jgi:RNA polymerase sigma factor (sigma-70 family)
MYEEEQDITIINRVLSGDSAAYGTLVKRYQSYVFTLTLRFIQSREDAEEVAQDIFVKAYRSLADFRGTAKFTTWLYTIVYTTSVSFLRKKKMPITSIDDEQRPVYLENRDSGMNANRVEQQSKLSKLSEAIAQLSPNDATVITLFYQNEQSLEEIGKVMGIDMNTAKVRLHRARQRLKEKLTLVLKGELADMIG